MAKTKRPHETSSRNQEDDMHPSRQKRLKYSNEDAALAKIYNDLADDVKEVRISAALELINNISVESIDRYERQDAAESRLIKGMCSGRKAARLGFTIAFAELVRSRLNRASGGDMSHFSRIVTKIVQLTKVEGNVSGQERRDYLFGRSYAFEGMLQSDAALDSELSDQDWKHLLTTIFDLAAERPWVRRECGSILYQYLNSRGNKLTTARVQAILNVAAVHKQLKTPEGVGLWLAIQQYPGIKLPKGVWHHNNPLASKERPVLSKALLEDLIDDDQPKKGGAKQTMVSFAWTVVLRRMFEGDESKHFEKFWESCVATTMFASTASTERKALGLQVFAIAMAMAPVAQLPTVLRPNIIRYILDQCTDPEKYLFEAAKGVISKIVTIAKQKPETAAVLITELILKSASKLNQLTRLKTLETITQGASDDQLADIVLAMNSAIRDADSIYGDQAETHRRMLADLLLTIVRSHKQSRSMLPAVFYSKDDANRPWLQNVLQALSRFAYNDSFPPATRAIMQARLMSCLNSLMDAPLDLASRAPALTAFDILKKHQLPQAAGEDGQKVTKDAKVCLRKTFERHADQPNAHAFTMLLSLGILQVYNGETDAVAVLEDIVSSYSNSEASEESNAMLIELLLSFISKQSSLFRKLAEQVFSVLAADITAESLQSLTDILAQKESLSSQQELFDDQEGEDGQANENDDGNMIDVEDAPDVELVNGETVVGAESVDDESDTSSAVQDGPSDGEDEEAVFDKKLADALGTAGMEDDSDEDGSDMDDEQMLALEPQLNTIFKERSKQTSRKQDKKDAKENIVNFKNRVLDLLMIYVKSQSGSVLALDVLLPLTSLIRTTTSKPTAEKAFAVLKQYFDASNKHKALPELEEHESCFTVLTEQHEEMKLGGSKLHANACSRSSLFLAKVLVNLDRQHYERIAAMYAKLQSEWYLDMKSKVQSSVFTEWMSWSISTRKQQ